MKVSNTWSFNCHREKNKILETNCQVVRDLLIKKLVFMNRNKQLSAMSSCLGNLLSPFEDIQTPIMSIS
jgi:hypothetical protein